MMEGVSRTHLAYVAAPAVHVRATRASARRRVVGVRCAEEAGDRRGGARLHYGSSRSRVGVRHGCPGGHPGEGARGGGRGDEQKEKRTVSSLAAGIPPCVREHSARSRVVRLAFSPPRSLSIRWLTILSSSRPSTHMRSISSPRMKPELSSIVVESPPLVVSKL
jgi:hypothetical protein